MSWPSPQQQKFLSAFTFAYAKTKPYSSQRNAFLKKLRFEWSTVWPLKPRREQTRVRIIEPRSNCAYNGIRSRCFMPSSASSIRERRKTLVDPDSDHAHTVAHAAGMLIQFPDCRFPLQVTLPPKRWMTRSDSYPNNLQMQESGYANHGKSTLITATSLHHVKPGRVRSYERKGFSFVEVDLPGISAADITLSLQDDRLTLYALNNLGCIAYEWETYILPTIPVSS